MGRPTGAAREGRCEWGRGRGRACLGEGGCRACFQSGPLFVGGGGGRGSKRSALLFPGPQGEPAHGLHPRFVVAEIWADRGHGGGGGGGAGKGLKDQRHSTRLNYAWNKKFGAMAPAPLSFKTRGGGGGWGVSHTKTGPGGPPPPPVCSYNHPPNSAKKSQQFGRTIRRAYFSANCFPVTRIMTLAPQTHCPFGCCVVRDMWKPL